MGTDTQLAGKALQSVFGESPSEDARTRVVEDLLDVKVLPEVDAHGKQFHADRVQERWEGFVIILSGICQLLKC